MALPGLHYSAGRFNASKLRAKNHFILMEQTPLRDYTVVAGFYDDGATCNSHVRATSPEHAAELAQLKIHGDKTAAGDLLDSELGPLVDGEIPEILYMIAIFEGHHANLYAAPEEVE